MEKPDPPHSYDYNEEGYVPPYCNNCGYGYPKKIINPRRLLTKISNGSLKKILSVLCDGGFYFDYNTKDKFFYPQLKDRNLSPYPLAEEIVLKANEKGIQLDWDLVINTIYTKMSFSS